MGEWVIRIDDTPLDMTAIGEADRLLDTFLVRQFCVWIDSGLGRLL